MRYQRYESYSDYVVLTPERRNGTRPWQGRQQAHPIPHITSDITSKIAHLALAVNSATLHALCRRARPGGLMRILGILLIVVGLISLALGGISYTKREKVLDIGPIEATAERHKTIPLPPLLGGLALAGGVVLLVVGGRKR